MLLALDVGNSNTVLGLFSDPTPETPAQLIADWRITTPQKQTSDELGLFVHQLFSLRGLEISDVTGVVISSVVPPLDPTLRRLAETTFNLRPLFIEPGVKTGVPIHTDNPNEAGADRIVNCAAAFDLVGGPTIVVDMGTATTFDVVSAKGEFLGGAIAPGLGISSEALFARAARLTRVEIKKPVKIIGTNTTDNIQIGLYYGYIGLVDGILERMLAELGPETHTLGTGGLARLIAPDSKYLRRVEPHLTLHGLRLIWSRNQHRDDRREARQREAKTDRSRT